MNSDIFQVVGSFLDFNDWVRLKRTCKSAYKGCMMLSLVPDYMEVPPQFLPNNAYIILKLLDTVGDQYHCKWLQEVSVLKYRNWISCLFSIHFGIPFDATYISDDEIDNAIEKYRAHYGIYGKFCIKDNYLLYPNKWYFTILLNIDSYDDLIEVFTFYENHARLLEKGLYLSQYYNYIVATSPQGVKKAVERYGYDLKIYTLLN